MNIKHSIALLALVVPVIATAQEGGKYQCTLGDLVRRVEIFTEPGVAVPCEVHYYKDTEAPGESQVLWSAQAQAGYCEAKTEEFVAALQGWGWNCTASAAPVPEAAPAPEAEEAEPPVYDDTDVLSPGDPSGS
jgi:hypothetical protein